MRISVSTRFTGVLDNNKKGQLLEGIGLIVIKCDSLLLFLGACNITPFLNEVNGENNIYVSLNIYGLQSSHGTPPLPRARYGESNSTVLRPSLGQ